MMGPHATAGLLAYGLTNALVGAARSVAEGNRRRQEDAALDAWSGALASARGSADAMAKVAVAAINKVAELEAQVAALHRAVRYRDEAIAALQ